MYWQPKKLDVSIGNLYHPITIYYGYSKLFLLLVLVVFFYDWGGGGGVSFSVDIVSRME